MSEETAPGSLWMCKALRRLTRLHQDFITCTAADASQSRHPRRRPPPHPTGYAAPARRIGLSAPIGRYCRMRAPPAQGRLAPRDRGKAPHAA